MARLTPLCSSTALATLIMSSSVLADVTPLQVWDDWLALMERTGAEVSFDQSISDGILTVNNLRFTAPKPDSDEVTVIQLGSLVFQDQGDGSVMVVLPTDAPIVVSSNKDQITLNHSHKDLSLVVSGAPKDLVYTYKATALSLTLVDLMVAGKRFNSATADIILSGVNGTTHSRNTGLREVTQDMTVGALSYRFDFNHVDEDTKVSSQGSVTDFQNSFSVAIPENIDTITLQGALNAGLKAIGNVGYSDIAGSFVMTQRGDVTNASVSSENGALDMRFVKGENDFVEMSQNIAFGPIKLHSDINIEGKDKGALMDFAIDQFGAGYTVNFPADIAQEGFEQDSFQKAMDAGASFTANAGYDGINGEFFVNKDDQSYVGNAISATAGFDMLVDRDNFRYAGGIGNTNMALTTAELPIGPLEFSVSEMRTNVVIPLKVSKTPAPFSYQDRIINLSVSENLWAMFDPDKMLPRDAVTYILDVSGMGNWLIDPFDVRFQNDDLAEPKGELHALTLNALQVTGAGINLTGTGDFTYDNDDLDTFDGIPAPTGAMNLKLAGGNTLIDTLIEMGLLPADEAMGVRMALSLFTIAGDGDDRLISDIEFTDDGQVLANGKRLK